MDNPDLTVGDRVEHVDFPGSTATVLSFPAPFRVYVRWESTGRTSEEYTSMMVRSAG